MRERPGRRAPSIVWEVSIIKVANDGDNTRCRNLTVDSAGHAREKTVKTVG